MSFLFSLFWFCTPFSVACSFFLLFLLTLPYHKIEFSLLNNWSEHTHTHMQSTRFFIRCPLLLLFNSYFMPFNLLFALCFCPAQLNSWPEQLHPLWAHLFPRSFAMHTLSNSESIKCWAVIKNQKCVSNHDNSNQRKFIKSQSKQIMYKCVTYKHEIECVNILYLFYA